MGYECVSAGSPAAAHRDLPLRRRAVQPAPRTRTGPTSGRNAFAHKGGMHVAGVQADARTFEHIEPELVGNSRDVLISELVRQGLGARAAPRARASTSTRTPPSGRVERVKEREHRGYQYEAADASFELLLRREAGQYAAALPARGLPRDHREARGRQGRDRGDDQDLGRRAALRAHRRGQRPGQRARPGAARGDHRAPSAPGRDRARRLQGADPRHAPRDRRRDPGAARLLRRPASPGERSASRRTSSRPRGRRWSTRSSTRSSRRTLAPAAPLAPEYRRPSSACASKRSRVRGRHGSRRTAKS